MKDLNRLKPQPLIVLCYQVSTLTIVCLTFTPQGSGDAARVLYQCGGGVQEQNRHGRAEKGDQGGLRAHFITLPRMVAAADLLGECSFVTELAVVGVVAYARLPVAANSAICIEIALNVRGFT